MTEEFKIRPYTKKELALMYSPDSDTKVAVNQLMRWIKRCTPLLEALQKQGYKKTCKCFTPMEVKLIIEYIGEPFS